MRARRSARVFSWLAAAALLAGAAPASAAPASGAPASMASPGPSDAPPGAGAGMAAATAAAPEPSSAPSRHFGFQLEAGVPGGGMLTAVVRPWPIVRFHAGLGYNVLALGIVGGATLVPWQGGTRVTFGLNAGHYFSADVNRLVSTDDAALKTFLADVASNFVSADVGLEIGSPDGSFFFVRLGIAYLFPSTPNLQQALNEANQGTGVTATVNSYSTSGRLPVLRIGFAVMAF